MVTMLYLLLSVSSIVNADKEDDVNVNKKNLRRADADADASDPVQYPRKLEVDNKWDTSAHDVRQVTETSGEVWSSNDTASPTMWTEFTVSNGNFYWIELHRDANSIYLQDDNGRDGRTVQIDLHTEELLLCRHHFSKCFSIGAVESILA